MNFGKWNYTKSDSSIRDEDEDIVTEIIIGYHRHKHGYLIEKAPEMHRLIKAAVELQGQINSQALSNVLTQMSDLVKGLDERFNQ